MFRVFTLLVVTASVLVLSAYDQPVRPTPVVRTIDPAQAKAGDKVVATGDNLGLNCVAEIYLTQGDNSFKAEIKSQTATSLTFVVPATVKAGRFGLMVLTTLPNQLLLDEPVSLTIE